MTQKTYVLKIILSIFIINMFFILIIPTTYADTNIIGSIDMSVENKVKICKDVVCAKPEIIDFRITDGFPLVIDKEKGVSGKAWGGELGWVTFNYPSGGVFFANSKTGLLKGTAWSETSGPINFSVTGQKVIINPKTGEWNGWAWASGLYGGWVKFDCKDNSCVHTVWSEKNEKEISSDVKNPKTNFSNFFSGIKEMIKEKSKIIGNTFDIFFTSSADLFKKAGQMTADAYNFLYSNMLSLENLIFRK